jgi:hypothetical protein
MTPSQIRTLAKKFAEETIIQQKRTFQNWAILGDWEKPYITMNPKYESAQLKVFLDMFKKGILLFFSFLTKLMATLTSDILELFVFYFCIFEFVFVLCFCRIYLQGIEASLLVPIFTNCFGRGRVRI